MAAFNLNIWSHGSCNSLEEEEDELSDRPNSQTCKEWYFYKKIATPGLFLFIFVFTTQFLIQLIANKIADGIEPRISSVGSDPLTNCTTTTALCVGVCVGVGVCVWNVAMHNRYFRYVIKTTAYHFGRYSLHHLLFESSMGR